MSRGLGTLVVLPGLRAVRGSAGRLIVTRKFISGMQSYAERWDGEVVTLMDVVERPSDNLDNVEVDPAEFPFGIELVRYGSDEMWTKLGGAAVVLGGPDHRIARAESASSGDHGAFRLLPRRHGSNPTRVGPLGASESGASSRQGSRGGAERTAGARRDLAPRTASSATGSPPSTPIVSLIPKPFLYFDTRAPAKSFATVRDLDKRAESLRQGRPLRLAYSGRLIRAKGADQLIEIARSLEARGVSFELTICGAGDLAPELARDISRFGLERRVRLAGVLDFEKELMPFLRDQVDLFIVPHRQGDPSCTYLETLACGVPIVGYENESFTGMLDRVEAVGWRVPPGRPAALAARIAALDVDRDAIVDRSQEALRFASEHSFVKTFDRRVEHLERVVTGTSRRGVMSARRREREAVEERALESRLGA